MPLPKVSHPTFPLLVPSLQRAHRFRPFTVREEKVLLMARESSDEKTRRGDWLRAVYTVVEACSEGLDVRTLATFDLEWLYLKIRAASVSSTVTQSFFDLEERDATDGVPAELREFTINLDEIKAPVVPEGNRTFKTADGKHAVVMRYPPASLYTDPEFTEATTDLILYKSTVVIEDVENGKSYRASESTREEVVEYFDGWASKDLDQVRSFIDSTPSVEYKIEYQNRFGHDRSVTLRGLSDFFIY